MMYDLWLRAHRQRTRQPTDLQKLHPNRTPVDGTWLCSSEFLIHLLSRFHFMDSLDLSFPIERFCRVHVVWLLEFFSWPQLIIDSSFMSWSRFHMSHFLNSLDILSPFYYLLLLPCRSCESCRLITGILLLIITTTMNRSATLFS